MSSFNIVSPPTLKRRPWYENTGYPHTPAAYREEFSCEFVLVKLEGESIPKALLNTIAKEKTLTTGIKLQACILRNLTK